MPTGYTAAVMDGKVTDFNQFAMQCARAMGACVMMRDEPWDVPIPEKFEPHDYNAKRLQEAKERLAKLRAMTSTEVEAACAADYEKRAAERQAYRESQEVENARLDAMERAVLDWLPPTASHVGMKDFMLEQIRVSRHDVGSLDRFDPIAHMSPNDWLQKQMDSAQRDIGYHAGEHAKEVERAASRTLWIKQLRESLSATRTDEVTA